MVPINGESKYSKRFDYTAIAKEIDKLHDDLIELKYSQPAPIFRMSLETAHQNNKLFTDRIDLAKLPENSKTHTKSRSKKLRFPMKENDDPNASPFFTNLMDLNAISSDRWTYSHLENRISVKQSRSRPAYLDDYIRQVHAKQVPRPELDAIDEPIRVQYRSTSPVPNSRASTTLGKSDAEIQSERLVCDQATITESVSCCADSATSPPPAFIQNLESDCNDQRHQLGGPVPFSILDLGPIEDINDIPFNHDFLSETNATSITPSIDITEESLLSLILQMFCSFALLEPATFDEQSKDTVMTSEDDLQSSIAEVQKPLVMVSVDVITSLTEDFEVTFARLSIEILDTNPKYIIYAEPRLAPLVQDIRSRLELECESNLETMDPDPDKKRDDTSGLHLKSESKDQLDVTPSSPRFRPNSPRRSLTSRGLEYRLPSPSRSVTETEVVQVEEFAFHSGMHLEKYEEIQDDDVFVESQLVQPFSSVQKGVVEVLVIVSHESDDVSIAIKIIELPTICIGSRSFRNNAPVIDLEMRHIPEQYDSTNELECDIQSEESGLICPPIATNNLTSPPLLSHIDDCISDRSVSSDDSDTCSTIGTDTDSVVLGFGSVVSSGEIMPSCNDGYSDGEITSCMLVGSRILLEYLSDSTDTESLN